MMSNFASGNCAPPRGARVVYVAGTWDLFHVGHAAFLKAARALGDYLVVGIHGDTGVSARRGDGVPIMNTQERVLSVLGCRYVDDALIDAPLTITTEIIESFGISIVAQDEREALVTGAEDPCAIPKARGIFRVVGAESAQQLSALEIANRIRERHDALLARYQRKIQSEEAYYAQRHATSVPP